jgi:hypothetical protein
LGNALFPKLFCHIVHFRGSSFFIRRFELRLTKIVAAVIVRLRQAGNVLGFAGGTVLLRRHLMALFKAAVKVSRIREAGQAANPGNGKRCGGQQNASFIQTSAQYIFGNR